jgi:hypothetical protein
VTCCDNVFLSSCLLTTINKASGTRCRYIEIYWKMAQALKATQITTGEFAGFWPPSLRAFNLDPKPESTGTAFCVGSLAWGIAEGILPPEEYLHVCTLHHDLFFLVAPPSQLPCARSLQSLSVLGVCTIGEGFTLAEGTSAMIHRLIWNLSLHLRKILCIDVSGMGMSTCMPIAGIAAKHPLSLA